MNYPDEMNDAIRNRVLGTYRQSTNEVVPFTDLDVDGLSDDPTTVQYAIIGEYADEATPPWVAAETSGSLPAFRVNGMFLGRGVFKVLYRLHGSTEQPSQLAGFIRVA